MTTKKEINEKLIGTMLVIAWCISHVLFMKDKSICSDFFREDIRLILFMNFAS